ncbi:MAG: nicotinate-nucleotide adenylyltransferase [Lachnospiraceae bacterium]|jgi:nicotinate-nucleotide adenylyltransferase|nr:nicotinate-nucleotide adenylyltransferase [Lachnospiraceae bacterium]
MESKKRVGIMGGTFNPIHYGHLRLAQEAQQQVLLDKILFMPSGRSYMKKNVLDTQKRVEMTALAIKQYSKFELSLIEAQKTGNTYTCETLQYLTRTNSDTQYYFIIGADSLFQIEQWRSPKQIFEFAILICAIRDDYDFDTIRKKGEALAESGADIIYLNTPKWDISSTDIRAKVKSRISIHGLVPPEVAHYIEQEHLYYEED